MLSIKIKKITIIVLTIIFLVITCLIFIEGNNKLNTNCVQKVLFVVNKIEKNNIKESTIETYIGCNNLKIQLIYLKIDIFATKDKYCYFDDKKTSITDRIFKWFKIGIDWIKSIRVFLIIFNKLKILKNKNKNIID